MAAYYFDLLAGADVFAIAAHITKQGWDSHSIAKRMGGRDDLLQEVALILLNIQAGKVIFDQDRKSRKTKNLYVGKGDYMSAVGSGDQLAAAYSLAESLASDDDIDTIAEIIYRTINTGKVRKELDRVWLGKTSCDTGGVVSLESFVMGKVRGRALGNWMVESPRLARDEQVVADLRIAKDLGGEEPGHHVTGEDEQHEEDEQDEADALSAWVLDKFSAELRNGEEKESLDDHDAGETPAHRLLQAKSIDLAHLLGCTPRTIQNMRTKAKPSA